MPGRNLTEKPTVADVTRWLLLSVPFLDKPLKGDSQTMHLGILRSRSCLPGSFKLKCLQQITGGIKNVYTP
jgi:hypothetical protein